MTVLADLTKAFYRSGGAMSLLWERDIESCSVIPSVEDAIEFDFLCDGFRPGSCVVCGSDRISVGLVGEDHSVAEMRYCCDHDHCKVVRDFYKLSSGRYCADYLHGDYMTIACDRLKSLKKVMKGRAINRVSELNCVDRFDALLSEALACEASYQEGNPYHGLSGTISDWGNGKPVIHRFSEAGKTVCGIKYKREDVSLVDDAVDCHRCLTRNGLEVGASCDPVGVPLQYSDFRYKQGMAHVWKYFVVDHVKDKVEFTQYAGLVVARNINELFWAVDHAVDPYRVGFLPVNGSAGFCCMVPEECEQIEDTEETTEWEFVGYGNTTGEWDLPDNGRGMLYFGGHVDDGSLFLGSRKRVLAEKRQPTISEIMLGNLGRCSY